MYVFVGVYKGVRVYVPSLFAHLLTTHTNPLHNPPPKVSASMRDEVQARDKLSAQQRDLARKAVDSESKVKRLTAELKRKDGELAKVQDKLREVLESKGNTARQLREMNSALHARNSSIGTRGGGEDVEARIAAVRETYEAQYRELAAKHSDLQSAYSRLQDTYKGVLFQQMRQGGAKENVQGVA